MIIFQNPGLIDLRSVQIMGLHAKETTNPIGQFGTGLKYAIAVLLRSNCQFTIFRGYTGWRFTATKEHFRGKEFDFVQMESMTPIEDAAETISLGFTLELGKHWEPWMAIRELESNCRDEGGQSWANGDYHLTPDSTTIVIQGTTADQEYQKLGDIFIKTEPLWKNEFLEVHPIENPNQERWIYYRGVRTAQQPKATAFRYNILAAKQLTEDRTFRYSWSGTEELCALRRCDNRDVLKKVLSMPKDSTEFEINFPPSLLSPEFIEETLCMGLHALPSAWKAVRISKGYSEFEEHEPDDIQRRMIDRARAFITKMGEPRIHNLKVHLSPDLGPNILGRVANGEIWLTLRVFEMGMKQVVSTMYEEYIHIDRKYSDLDYELQNFLFDTIITQAARLQGEIL